MEHNFTKLRIWQLAHELTLKIYEASSHFPKEETFGLTSQLRRAAVSIELNNAEGESRYYQAEKFRFFVMARGSISEVINCLLIAKDLDYKLEKNSYNNLLEEYTSLIKQTNSLINHQRKIKSNG